MVTELKFESRLNAHQGHGWGLYIAGVRPFRMGKRVLRTPPRSDGQIIGMVRARQPAQNSVFPHKAVGWGRG